MGSSVRKRSGKKQPLGSRLPSFWKGTKQFVNSALMPKCLNPGAIELRKMTFLPPKIGALCGRPFSMPRGRCVEILEFKKDGSSTPRRQSMNPHGSPMFRKEPSI